VYWSSAGGIDKPENTVEPTAYPDAVPAVVVTAKAARSEAVINLERLIVDDYSTVMARTEHQLVAHWSEAGRRGVGAAERFWALPVHRPIRCGEM
jgi:hypothetical protein